MKTYTPDQAPKSLTKGIKDVKFADRLKASWAAGKNSFEKLSPQEKRERRKKQSEAINRAKAVDNINRSMAGRLPKWK